MSKEICIMPMLAPHIMQTIQLTTWKNEVPFAVEIKIDHSQSEAEIDAKLDKLFEATLKWIQTQSAVDISRRQH